MIWVLDPENPAHFPDEAPLPNHLEKTTAGWREGEKEEEKEEGVFSRSDALRAIRLKLSSPSFLLLSVAFSQRYGYGKVSRSGGKIYPSTSLKTEPIGEDFLGLGIVLMAYCWPDKPYTVFKVARDGEGYYRYYAILECPQ